MDQPNSHKELLPHLFRQEYAKMTAVLCRHFGLKYIEIAEDIASDTFLKASEHWAVKGIPENPTAWLYTVARNKAKNYFKRASVFETQVKDALIPDEIQAEEAIEYNSQIISDSQLAMILSFATQLIPPGHRSVWHYKSCAGSAWKKLPMLF